MLHDLRAATSPACGGKARNLARLIAAGLPVPDGFVLDDAAFRLAAGELAGTADDDIGHALAAAAARIASAELPVELVREVETRAAALGGELAVRSSATIEDAVGGSAAGVFASMVRVPVGEVWSAIRAVWMSALTPLAVAYGRRRDRELAIGVIVQRFVPGERVTIYTRPPGKPSVDAALVQRAGELATVTRADVPLAIRAEVAIGATYGADIELAGDAFVQARPIVHPVPHARTPAPPALLAPLVADGRVWTWDVAHNPDPLSLAQAELVARADPEAMRVCAGYLYYTAAAHPPAPTRTAAEIEHALAETLGAELPTLAEALDRYAAFYRIWARELKPLTSGARSRAAARGARPSAVEATLFACVRGELDEAAAAARLGVLSPAWDVAVPTYGERPGAISRALEAARRIGAPPPAPADEEADLAERDDAWFARAQLLVRRAILARAGELGIDRDDAFWIPVEDLLRGSLTADDVRRRASGARNAAARAAKWAMPLAINAPAALDSSETESPRVLRGVGTGPRVTGRVVRFATLAAEVLVGTGDVVVVRAVTPALAVAVIGCAAIVSETGGLLDHGAALARELDIPCVVGCRGAASQLADGMVVTVDGDAGSVEIT